MDSGIGSALWYQAKLLSTLLLSAPDYLLQELGDLLKASLGAIAVLTYAFARRWPRPVRLAALGLFPVGLIVWELLRLLFLIGPDNRSASALKVVFVGPALCLIGIACFLGYLPYRVQANIGLSRKVLILGGILGAVLTALTMFNDPLLVERQRFDPVGPYSDSDYIRARGWPEAFIADISDDKPNLPVLPGDTLLYKPLVMDWIACTYVAMILVLVGRKWASRLTSQCS